MECLHFPQFSSDHSVVHAALYTNVTNTKQLKKRIVAASTALGEEGEREREAVNFAFIDARLLTSQLHLQTAIHQAILAESQGSLRTKTVHSEILWVLNPTNNITEAIRRYGVSDATTALAVVKVGGPGVPASEIEEKMSSAVQGTIVSFASLETLTDWPTIKKYHKLNDDMAAWDEQGDGGWERGVVDNIVVSTVAMKTVMS